MLNISLIVVLQVSGLKSITSKHLALASQVISFVHAIIPGMQLLYFYYYLEVAYVLIESLVYLQLDFWPHTLRN